MTAFLALLDPARLKLILAGVLTLALIAFAFHYQAMRADLRDTANDLLVERAARVSAEQTVDFLKTRQAETEKKLSDLQRANDTSFEIWTAPIADLAAPAEENAHEKADRLTRANAALNRMLERETGPRAGTD